MNKISQVELYKTLIKPLERSIEDHLKENPEKLVEYYIYHWLRFKEAFPGKSILSLVDTETVLLIDSFQKRYDGQTIFNFETYKELKDKFISIWPIFEINFEIEDNNLYISWCEVEKGYEPTENDWKDFENGIINLYNCCIIINEINKIESINDISQIPFE